MRKSLAFTWIELLVVIAVIGMLAVFLLPPMGHPEAGRRAVCMNNLSQLALALLNYHSKYDAFPPAYVADEDGKPLYSWRVLILPMIEGNDLYNEFRLDEPWDSEANIKLLDRMPTMFRCPSNKEKMLPGHTSYVRIVGPGTITDGPNSVTEDDIIDGVSQTILVTETLEVVPWTAPVDISFDKLDHGVNSESGRGIGSKHPGIALAAFADRSVRPLIEPVKPETLRALSTIDGGETVTID